MLVFDRLRKNPVEMAIFLGELVKKTEEDILFKLHEYGIETCIVSPPDEVRTLEFIDLLLTEADDADSEHA